MDFTALENLKMLAVKSFATLDSELDSTRKALAALGTPEAKKTYTPEHRAQKEASIRAKAKEIGSLQRAELMNLATRLGVTKNAWSTATLLKRSRFFAGDKIEHEIAEELRRLRLANDLRDATATELVEMAVEAKDTKNLALLAMLNKAAGRRMYETDAERALVHVEIGKAIAEVEPEGQKQAHALITQVESTLEHVEDAITELLTGQEPKRAEVRRVIAGKDGNENRAT